MTAIQILLVLTSAVMTIIAVHQNNYTKAVFYLIMLYIIKELDRMQ